MTDDEDTGAAYHLSIAATCIHVFGHTIRHTVHDSLFHWCFSLSQELKDTVLAPALWPLPANAIPIHTSHGRTIVMNCTSSTTAFTRYNIIAIPEPGGLPVASNNNINRFGITIRPPSLTVAIPVAHFTFKK